ncbi:MAG: type III pantothenate kinase [Melioribacteraceae bacterium]
MILCIDVGNTQIHGGVFKGEELAVQFRKTARQQFSSDEIGIFLRSVLRENKIDADSIKGISICSVVPDLNHSLRSGCIKYFGIDPFFLKAGVKTGLKIRYRNPLEVGSDRIANAIAAVKMFPNHNIIVVDFGTATTFCAISKTKDYLGGIILPGIRISMEVLENRTAQLPSVEIKKTESVLGRSAVESIQSGLFYGQVGIVKELKFRITREVFSDDEPVVIGTGGFSSLFENEGLFNIILPTLALKGLHLAYYLNENNIL